VLSLFEDDLRLTDVFGILHATPLSFFFSHFAIFTIVALKIVFMIIVNWNIKVMLIICLFVKLFPCNRKICFLFLYFYL